MQIIIQNFIGQYGMLSVFTIVFLEYSNFPIPSEVVLPIVGIMASNGIISIHQAVIISVLAGIIGSLLNYYLGYYMGKSLIKKIVSINSRLQKSVDSSMWWINKYGELAVMLSRIMPLARTFISIPAGVIKMNIVRFVMYSSIGISVWNLALIYLGYICGNNMELIGLILGKYSFLTVMSISILILIYYRVSRKNKKEKNVKKV